MYVLLEDGSYTLLETGDKLLLELQDITVLPNAGVYVSSLPVYSIVIDYTESANIESRPFVQNACDIIIDFLLSPDSKDCVSSNPIYTLITDQMLDSVPKDISAEINDGDITGQCNIDGTLLSSLISVIDPTFDLKSRRTYGLSTRRLNTFKGRKMFVLNTYKRVR